MIIDKSVILKKTIDYYKILRNTRIQFYKSISVPVLLYGCESWITTEMDESKIKAVVMRFLRWLKAMFKETVLEKKTFEMM